MKPDVKKLRPTNIEESIEAAGVLLNVIPAIGGLLSGIVLQTTSASRWERLTAFLESIQNRMKCLESLSNDHEEIAVEIVERVVRERSEEKTDCYRNILLNGLNRIDFDYDKTLEMVKLVERLTANHIRILQVIRDPVAAEAALGSSVYPERPVRSLSGLPTNYLGLFLVRPFFPDWPAGELDRIWEELCDVHILGRVTPHIDLPPSNETIGIDMVVTCFNQYITESGYEFIRHVLTVEADRWGALASTDEGAF